MDKQTPPQNNVTGSEGVDKVMALYLAGLTDEYGKIKWTLEHHKKVRAELKALIRQELEAVMAEMPKKYPQGQPGLAATAQAIGFNEAIDQTTEVIMNRIKQL